MVKPIMRDPLFLAQKSEPATEADKQVIQDLLDTLKAMQRLLRERGPLRQKKAVCHLMG